MIAPARDWLPAEAGDTPGVRKQIEALVAEWSANWFAADGPILLSWTLREDMANASSAAWRDGGGGLRSSCTAQAAQRLACMALGARTEQTDLGDRDRFLLSALARRIIDDLIARLRRLLAFDVAAPPPAQGGPAFLARIADGEDTLVSVVIPFAALMQLCRQSLPRPRPATGAIQSARTAVTPTIVSLRATLGAAVLDLATVRDLAVGDLLLLDTTVEQPLELSIGGVWAGQGLLTEVDGQAALILQSVQ